MSKRHLFLSYHHNSNKLELAELRKKTGIKKFGDYGFKYQNLGKNSDLYIAKKIKDRLWSISVTVVLIGAETGKSAWIDWEIWYSLQSYQNPDLAKRRFNPKGLLALYLPGNKHDVPARLQANIDSGYAKELHFKDVDTSFEKMVEEAYKNRQNRHLIRNEIPLRDDPRSIFENLNPDQLFRMGSDWLKGLL